MKCIIVSNGSISDYSFYNSLFDDIDFIICADGGAKHLVNMSITPNVIIGDLDSISEADKELLLEKDVQVVKYDTNKDFTDTELALDFALSKEPTEIIFLGSIGSRIDHSFANITLLKKLCDINIRGKIINENNEIYLLSDKINEIILNGKKNEYLSIIPLSEIVKGVTLEGLKYPLDNVEIPQGSSLGISNEFTNKSAKIKIDEGLLLVIKARD